MSEKTLKCATCNIVISEILSFIQNKVDVIAKTNLISICESAFSIEDIKHAKSLLFESVKTTQRKVNRRNDGQKRRDLEDILDVFRVLEPEDIPIFVARDLHKLPPVTFDHIDVTKFLKDLVLLRSEMEYVKENYATVKQLQDMKKEFQTDQIPGSLSNRKINLRRGGYLLDSGPMGLSVVDAIDSSVNTSVERSNNNNMEYRSLALSRADDGVPITCTSGNSTLLQTSLVVENQLSDNLVDNLSTRRTMAEVVQEGKKKREKSTTSNPWILVEKKRPKMFTGRKGLAISNTSDKFRAADLKIPLFITYVNKDTSVEDICDYIKNKTNESVFLEKIAMKTERSYNAFKCYVPKIKLDVFLNDQLWPDGIIFRRFMQRRSDSNGDNRQINLPARQNGEQVGK